MPCKRKGKEKKKPLRKSLPLTERKKKGRLSFAERKKQGGNRGERSSPYFAPIKRRRGRGERKKKGKAFNILPYFYQPGGENQVSQKEKTSFS